MNLSCKCGMPLAKGLCKALGSNFVKVYTDETEDDYDIVFRPGFFKVIPAQPAFSSKYHVKHPALIMRGVPKRFRVAKSDLLIDIPKMPRGEGCCDWSFGSTLHCKCGRALGQMYLDCYEEKYIDIFETSVHRSY